MDEPVKCADCGRPLDMLWEEEENDYIFVCGKCDIISETTFTVETDKTKLH
jgi:endogenous inhibitor of DNA gyrase (YacG/DUF329 family)